jgi:hypothetical protein
MLGKLKAVSVPHDEDGYQWLINQRASPLPNAEIIGS